MKDRLGDLTASNDQAISLILPPQRVTDNRVWIPSGMPVSDLGLMLKKAKCTPTDGQIAARRSFDQLCAMRSSSIVHGMLWRKPGGRFQTKRM